MYVSGLGPTLRRHWLVAAAGALVTFGLCAAALSLIAPTYQATASVLILPSRSVAGDGGNPYLALGGLKPTADAVARAMADEEVSAGLQAAGATGAYTIEADRTTSGPVLVVTVAASQRTDTVTTLRLVLKRLPETLAALQEEASVPKRAQLISQVLAQDRVASPVLKSRIRGLAVAAALGIGLTVSAVVLVDNVSRLRPGGRRRRQRVERLPEPDEFRTRMAAAARPSPARTALPADRDGIDEDTTWIPRPNSTPPVDEETTRLRAMP